MELEWLAQSFVRVHPPKQESIGTEGAGDGNRSMLLSSSHVLNLFAFHEG